MARGGAGMGMDHEVTEEAYGIAVVGMAGRFPGARGVDDLWRDLRGGVQRIVRFSDAELLAAGVDPSLLANPRYVRAGAPVDDIDLFDAPFFGISPREAQAIDPQHRLFLEVAWETLERAGHDPQSFPGLIGVFAGSTVSGYQGLALADPTLLSTLGPVGIIHGTEKDHLTARASYKLNLRGPSLTVQTACSTSLVAVCLACQSLLAHECDLALAGGVALRAEQRAGYEFHEGGMASPDGTCRAFDAAAAGTVWGNGIGLVALRRLEDALADGDHVHAVIRGAAINNDGSRKVGYAAPSVDGIADAVAMAQAVACVEPDAIGFVEAHGTGTPLGDAVEVAALTRVFRGSTVRRQYCALGSIKPNLGHLDAASGIVSFIKAVLAVEHGEVPPTLHFERPNPALELEHSPFFVNAEALAWPLSAGRRRAAVNSFGIGGTNAHVILEEAPPSTAVAPDDGVVLLTLSAGSQAALDRLAGDLATHLADHPEQSLADVAYTAHVGRRSFPVRRVIVGKSRPEIVAALATPGSTLGVVLAGIRASSGVDDADLSRALAAGQAFASGGDVDWVAFHHGRARRRVPLPTYPFERRRYWVSPSRAPAPAAGAAPAVVAPPGEALARPNLGSPFVAPATEDERRIASKWEDLLGVAGVGTRDSFLELGGHSLLATRLLSWVVEEFGVEVSLVRFFEGPTVALLAQLVSAQRATGGAPRGARIPRARRDGQGRPS